MHSLVFLLDVDNTLLDNDRSADDLTTRLTSEFGETGCAQDAVAELRELGRDCSRDGAAR